MIQSFTAPDDPVIHRARRERAVVESLARLGIRSPLAIQALVLSDAPAVDVLAGAPTGSGRHSHSETR